MNCGHLTRDHSGAADVEEVRADRSDDSIGKPQRHVYSGIERSSGLTGGRRAV